MKFIFIILCFYCYNFNNVYFINKTDIISENNIIKYIDKPKNNIGYYTNEIVNSFYELIIKYFKKNLDLNKYIEEFDNSICQNFIINSIVQQRDLINLIAKKRVRSGFSSNSIETEDECIESNEVYILLKGNYTKDSIYGNIKEYSNQRLLFIERFSFDHELCLWDFCKNVYIYNNSEIIRDVEPTINKLFQLDHFELVGVNYKINGTTSYKIEHKNDSYEYLLFLKFFLSIISIILIICTFYSIYIKNKKEKDENIQIKYLYIFKLGKY